MNNQKLQDMGLIRPLILLSLLIIFGCGSDGGSGDGSDTGTPMVSDTGSAEIGSAGGGISDTYGTKLIIPPGALIEEMLISFETHLGPETLPSPAPFFAGAHFEPDGLVFSKPVTMTLQLESPLPPSTELPLFIFDPIRDAWAFTDSSLIVNDDGLTASGQITHFSDYVAFGPPYYDANLSQLHDDVMDVCDYRPLTEIFDDFVNNVSSTFEIGQKKIWDFSAANPIRQEACYELVGIDFVWNVETSIPDVNSDCNPAVDPHCDNWISQERRDLYRIIGREGNFAMGLYDEFDQRTSIINCGERQAIYQLNVRVWWACTVPEFSIEVGADEMCKEESTDVKVEMVCGNEPMSEQPIDFTATGPGDIFSIDEETQEDGSAIAELFSGNSGGTLTAKANYLACEGQETQEIVDPSTPVEVQDAEFIEVVPPSASLCVGDSAHPSWFVLDHKGDPVDCYESTWSSSNPSVAQVNSLTGAISAISQGSAQMTIVTEQATTTMNVTVGDECMSISPSNLCVEVGETAKLSVIAGVGVDLGEIIWISSDETVALVDATGNVTALGEGPALITAVAGGVMAEATLDVRESCLSIDPSSACLHTPISTTETFPTSLAPLVPTIETAMEGHGITYSSSNVNVASVDSSGLVKAIAGGTADITVEVDNIVTSYQTEIPVSVAGNLDDYKSVWVSLPYTENLMPYADRPRQSLFLTNDRELYTYDQVALQLALKVAACGDFPEAPDYYTIMDFNLSGEYIGYAMQMESSANIGSFLRATGLYLDSELCLFSYVNAPAYENDHNDSLYSNTFLNAINDNGLVAGTSIPLTYGYSSDRKGFTFSKVSGLNNPLLDYAPNDSYDFIDVNDEGEILFGGPIPGAESLYFYSIYDNLPGLVTENSFKLITDDYFQEATSLNNYGVVTGNYLENYQNLSLNRLSGFLYFEGNISSPTITLDGTALSTPHEFLKINNSQDVLGVSGASPFVMHICPFSVETNVCDWIDDPYRSDAIKDFEQTELSCDGLDNDCDGVVDENLVPDPTPKQLGVCAGAEMTCTGRDGWVAKYITLPGYEFPEVSCDGQDNDCDGDIDEGIDADKDTFYGVPLCGEPKDCNDSDASIYPGAIEICNGKDDNCNGVPDEGCP